ncbi:MAG TPA: RNA polymerase sigma factor [Terriglobales bacterium]|jgi:RNA polymerase sigma-70 factor, ECF subfamily|nr:RNA polymerase sigma factor [Terriglobales bacterium]
MGKESLHPFAVQVRIRGWSRQFLDSQRQLRLQSALARCAQGERAAFAEIVQEHQAMVFSIALHYLQDRSLAEDLAQEVFLELYQRITTLESAEHLTYWLRRVTANRCIDQSRRKKHRRETALDDSPEPVTAATEADPLLLGRLQESLATLPERHRMMVVLRYQEELGPAEIAELLSMPVNTVKSTLHRTLEELRKKLTRKLGGVRYAIF